MRSNVTAIIIMNYNNLEGTLMKEFNINERNIVLQFLIQHSKNEKTDP